MYLSGVSGVFTNRHVYQLEPDGCARYGDELEL